MSYADTLSFSMNARTFETQHQSLLVKSLAYSCLSLEYIPDSLPCNPAMTSRNRKAGLKGEGLISNGYSNIDKTRRLLSSNIDQQLINDLFTNEPVVQLETSIDVMFTSQFLNSKYSPFTHKYFAVLRNKANPDVEMYAIDEQSLILQTGYSFGDIDIGLAVKKNDWKFIKQRFKILDLSTPSGQSLLKPKTQSAIFIEPAINYRFKSLWSPRLSAQVVNSGYLSEQYDEFEHPVELQFGFGLSPEIAIGRLDLLVDYKSLNSNESDQKKIHIGGLYNYGAMTLATGVDDYGMSLGVFYGLEQINAGILFSTTKLPWRQDDYYSQTVYLQLGWQL